MNPIGQEHRDADDRGVDHDPHPHQVDIVVNGRPKVVTVKELTFDAIVALADGLPSGPDFVFTVTYRRGPRGNASGTVVAGDSVKVHDGMIFNVTATDRS